MFSTSGPQSVRSCGQGLDKSLRITDWQVPPGDLVASLEAGRLPRLTWGSTILGRFVAFWFLFGLAGIYAVFTDRSVSLLPAEGGAGESASGTEVPFEVTGSGLGVFRGGKHGREIRPRGQRCLGGGRRPAGGIYEDLGQTDLARREYGRFLRVWAHADTDLPQLSEARAALERLRG